MLTDNFRRVHDYLRISVTDRCNFRCSYCIPFDLPKGYFANAPRMTAEEIDKIVSVFIELGIKKIRFTGGEPLIRRDIDKIIRATSRHPVELAITTNGVLINNFVELFKSTGLRSINISLDSLNPEKFRTITKRDDFKKVLSNIHLLLLNNFQVKINVVLIRGVNEDEIPDFVGLTKKYPIHLRFIEFMPFSGNYWEPDKVFPLKEILSIIESKYNFIKLNDDLHDTAKKYKVVGHQGTFAVISTMSDPFCGDCNRLRLTADGKMKNCLFSREETDLLTPLRNGADVKERIIQCVLDKKEKQGGQFDSAKLQPTPSIIKNRSMVSIGG